MNDEQKPISADEESPQVESDSTEQTAVSEQPSKVDDSFLREVTPEKVSTEEITRQDQGSVDTNFWDEDDNWLAAELGETPGGKHLQVVKRKEGSGYRLQFQEAGELKDEYKGWYTSYDKAVKAGSLYLVQMQGEKSAKTGS